MADRLDRIEALKSLAAEYNIRSAPKLRKQALLDGVNVSIREAQEALRIDMPRQIFAPKARPPGKSTAEGPNDRLQFDLIDMANTDPRNPNRFALVGIDVFTRELVAKPMESKTAAEVNEAFQETVGELVDGDTNYVVSTDQGREFARLDEALPEEAVHRTKDPDDKNALAVLDANMKTLKVDLASRVAKDGRDWNVELPKVVKAWNNKPHDAVYGPPSQIESKDGGDNPQMFRVTQDNAEKFVHNRKVTQRKMASVRDAGGFRAPTGATRSFLPQYGDVRGVGTVDNLYVTAADGRKTLLKQAQPAPAGSTDPVRTLVIAGRNFQI